MKNMFKAKLSYIAIVVVAGSILMSGYPCFAAETVNVDAYKKKVKEWQDLKYGLFVHWGPCSVAGIEIGWARNAPRQGISSSPYPNSIPREEYDNLYKQFNPVDFDADQWMQTLKEAGLKYIVLTVKHCDGFMMWDTKTSDYNIMNSPYGKDISKELADACHKHGIKLGWYYAPCDWYDLDCRNTDPKRHDIYIKRMQEQLRELMTNYGKVDMLWFDGDGGSSPWDQDNTYAIIRNLQPDIMINNRLDFSRDGMGSGYGGWSVAHQNRLNGKPTRWKYFGDYDASHEGNVGGWDTVPQESCMSMIIGQWAWKPNAWLYSATDGANLLVRSLVNNGNFLYNVGPMPNGEIEDRQKERLLSTGKWLDRVGEAVYETTGGPILPGHWGGTSTWGGTTTKGKKIYVFMPDELVNKWNKEDPYPLTPLDKKLVSVESLTGEKVTAAQNSDGLIQITLPEATAKREDGEADYMIIKLTFDEENPQIKEGVTLSQGNMVNQSRIKPGGSIAFVGTATMNPGQGWGHYPQHANDGDSNTLAQSISPVWGLNIDLRETYSIDKITILPEVGVWANEYTIKVSTDNKNWTTVHTATNAKDQLSTIEFDKIDAQYVWMDVAGVGHTGSYGHSINEFEIFMAKE